MAVSSSIVPAILTIALAAALLAGQADLPSVLAQADALSKTYLDRGQTSADKSAILDFLAAHDRELGADPAYLLAKFRLLMDVGESERAFDVFDLIPDDALSAPTDLANRLRARFVPDPAAALPLARRLAAASMPAFVRWVHQSLAQQYAPAIKPAVDTPAHDAVLAALSESGATAGAVSALRAWRDAQRMNDASLRGLAQVSASAPEAYAPRYRLLLADRLEARPALEADARALRQRVVAGVREEVDALASGDEKRPRDRYWLAFAYAAEARAARARRDRDAELAALAQAARFSPDGDDRRMRHLYAYEKATLGGADEYRSAYADALESAGRLDDALAQRADIARLDPQTLQALQRLFARVRPGDSFDSYWLETQLAGRPAAPDFSLASPSGSIVALSSFRGRWVLLDFWGTWCQPCQAEMPDVDALAREHPGHVLTVAMHDAAATVASYMRQRGFSFPVAIGTDEVERAYAVPYYPFKLLIAPDGRTLPVLNENWREQALRHLR